MGKLYLKICGPRTSLHLYVCKPPTFCHFRPLVLDLVVVCYPFHMRFHTQAHTKTRPIPQKGLDMPLALGLDYRLHIVPYFGPIWHTKMCGPSCNSKGLTLTPNFGLFHLSKHSKQLRRPWLRALGRPFCPALGL